MEESGRETLTPEEKILRLFLSQKSTLDTFLENGVISRAQYEKSLGDLKRKMKLPDTLRKESR